MKRLWILSVATMALLMSCQPQVEDLHIDEDKPPVNPYYATLLLASDHYITHIYDARAPLAPDPIFMHMQIDGLPASASQLSYLDATTGKQVDHFIVMTLPFNGSVLVHDLPYERADLIHPEFTSESNFPVFVFYATDILAMGGIPLTLNRKIDRENLSFSLYRVEYDPHELDAYQRVYTRVSEYEDIRLSAISYLPVVRASLKESLSLFLPPSATQRARLTLYNLTINGNLISQPNLDLLEITLLAYDYQGNDLSHEIALSIQERHFDPRTFSSQIVIEIQPLSPSVTGYNLELKVSHPYAEGSTIATGDLSLR